MAELLERLRENDEVNPLEVFLTEPSFSQYFARLDEVRQVEDETVQVTDALKQNKQQLNDLKQTQENSETKSEGGKVVSITQVA